jgi:ribosomal protein S27E
MQPLYLARIEDLGWSDFVKVDCAGCHHVALVSPEFLLRLGLNPRSKVLDLTGRVRCRGCGARGRAVISVKWGKAIAGEPRFPLAPASARN